MRRAKQIVFETDPFVRSVVRLMAKSALVQLSHASPTAEECFTLADTYEGDVTIFPLAYVAKVRDIYIEGHLPKKENDGIDLNHFWYIRKGDTFAADDNGIAKIAATIGLRCVNSNTILTSSRP